MCICKCVEYIYVCMCVCVYILGMQRYHFFRTDPIRKIGRSADTNPIPAQFYFIFINVEFLYFSVLTRLSLFCVKHSLLQCFSTGGSKVLGMQPKSGSRGRSEWVTDSICPKKRHQQQKQIILNVFLMRDFHFNRRAGKHAVRSSSDSDAV